MHAEYFNEIVLFDGECNFCDSSVQFIIRHEKEPRLKFASLQSEVGKTLLDYYKIDRSKIDSVVLIEKGKAYVKSAGALRLTRHLKGGYPLLYGFIIIPPFMRNAVYDLIAKNRYKWFGKKDSCMIPSPELRARFVDL